MAKARILDDIASQTIALMNEGCDLNTILQRVRAPADLLKTSYLRARYDDPAFVARSIWHLYAGWYDGNPSHLKPVADAELGAEIAALAGGVERLAERAEDLNAQGQPYLAAALIEFAVAANPNGKNLHRIRAVIYASCVGAETSLIGKALFSVPMRESQKISSG